MRAMISFGDLLDELGLVDRVRDRRDDDLPAAALLLLELVLAAHADRALAGLVDLAQLHLAVEELAAGREVGAVDVLDQLLDVELGLVDSAISAAMTSPRLCGGMFVAMPTAMPVEPLIRSCGMAPAARSARRAWRRIGAEVDGVGVELASSSSRDAR